jgi:hypothetical protein
VSQGKTQVLYPSQNEGDRIRAIRAAKGWTLDEAAERAQVGYRLMYGIENWGWVTLPRLAERIGKALGWPKDLIHKVTGPDVKYEECDHATVGESGLMVRRSGGKG